MFLSSVYDIKNDLEEVLFIGKSNFREYVMV